MTRTPTAPTTARTMAEDFQAGSAVLSNLQERYLEILNREHCRQPEESDAEALIEVLDELGFTDEDYQHDLGILSKAANLEQASAGCDDVERTLADARKRHHDLIDDLERFTKECEDKLRATAGEISTLDMQRRPMKDAKGQVTGLRRRHHLLFPGVEPLDKDQMRPQRLGLKLPESGLEVARYAR